MNYKIRIENKNVSFDILNNWKMADKLRFFPAEVYSIKSWDLKKKSCYIESILLNLPLESFFLFEDINGNKYTINGNERFSAIFDFIENKYSLEDLQLNKSLNNKYFKDLEGKYESIFYYHIFSINIMDCRTPAELRYEICKRYNDVISIKLYEIITRGE
jgi:hypothetical protein